MYHHIKKLMYTVNVGTPDPRFGNMLLEQFGGANGELAAAMQYSIQGLNCDDPERKDLLMDIGTEELSHLEIVGTLARMHLKPMKAKRDAAEVDPLIAIAGGGGVGLFNSMGDAWTAGKPVADGEMADAPTFDEAFGRFVAGAAAAKPDLPKELLRVLARRHGSGLDDLLENVNSVADLGRAFGGHLYEAEVRYLMREEWAVEPEDVLWRRTKEGLHMSAAQRAAFAGWMTELRPNFT
jgi:hypothetical protein